MSLNSLKGQLTANKGHLTRATCYFDSLLKMEVKPPEDNVRDAHNRIEKRMDILFNLIDDILSHIEETKVEDPSSEDKSLISYGEEVSQYSDHLISLRCEYAGKFSTHNLGRMHPKPDPNCSLDVKSANTHIKLRALSPPSWNGNICDFYTWKAKFHHILKEANITDDLTQLCYLLSESPSILPRSYSSVITDCVTMKEAMDRLEERIPKDVIKHEVIEQFHRIKSLPRIRTAKNLREFAQEISLFCRRMSDLGHEDEANSILALQNVYQRLDDETARGYRTEMRISQKLGASSVESLESLSNYLRAEAVTLELSTPFKAMLTSPDTKGNNVQLNAIETGKAIDRAKSTTCELGCNTTHKLVECDAFLNMHVDERRKRIRLSRRCYVCLGLYHNAKDCDKVDWICRNCNKKDHHWTLCPTSSNAPPSQTPERQIPHFHHKSNNENTLLPVVIIEVLSHDGSWSFARCLLDSGSTSTIVSKQFAHSLNLPTNGQYLMNFGTAGGSLHQELVDEFDLTIRAQGDSHCISSIAIKKPCFRIKPLDKNILLSNPHLHEICNHIYLEGGDIDILIGMDNAPLIVPIKVLRAEENPDDFLSAAFTRLGWYVYGNSTNNRNDKCKNRISQVNYLSQFDENEVSKFILGDLLGVKPSSICVCSEKQIAESSFIKHVRNTTTMSETGRVCVKMPWKEGFPSLLPNNYEKSVKMMIRRENQVIRDELLTKYNNEIENLITNGFVKQIDSNEIIDIDKGYAWYLNHRLIEKTNSSCTKLRLVFDSAASFKGYSLNAALEKGPDYLNPFLQCFMRFRQDSIALTGDIIKMFNQIEMHPDDQPYHRFLWRFGDVSRDIAVFQWLRLIFGDKPSPDLAGYTIKFLAESKKESCPNGYLTLCESTYVDDIGSSTSEVKEAEILISEVNEILAQGKFEIKAWNSNCPSLDENSEEVVSEFLGHEWNKLADTINIKPRQFFLKSTTPPTKRTILALVAKLWDPIGCLLPASIKYRIELQKLWQKGYQWDEFLPEENSKVWYQWCEEMEALSSFKIRRCLKPSNSIGLPELHTFSDGGQDAYGACIFLRWNTATGVDVRFVNAKAFVAPVKTKTTPRLELMAALVMSRLTHEIMKVLPYNYERIYFWVDSKVVIHWLNSESRQFKPFVSSRTQEILDTHPNIRNNLFYVPSSYNCADALTKSIPANKLDDWHQGPPFLKLPESQWPYNTLTILDNEHDLKPYLEEKPDAIPKSRKFKSVNSFLESNSTVRYPNIGEKYSSWEELQFSIAFALHIFRSRTFFVSKLDNHLSPEILSDAKMIIFKLAQKDLKENMCETKRKLLKLNPVIDDKGFIRSDDRLVNIDLPSVKKNLIILPGSNPIMMLFLKYQHVKFLHQGYRVVLANLANSGVFIVAGRKSLKSIANSCMFCRIRRRKLLSQKMAALPKFRIQPNTPPFTSVSLDFFGFIHIKLSRNVTSNASVLILTCNTTRCIHLEVCLTIDTWSFIRAWRRFCTMRGIHPAHVFSDCAPTFKQSNQVIKDWIQNWDSFLIQKEMSVSGTNLHFDWTFNTPYASHMNGVTESLINSVRKALDASVINYMVTRLTYEEWATILSEITYIINSRPLTLIGNTDDLHCLTGNMILYPHGQPDLPQHAPEDIVNYKNTLKLVQNRVDAFWNSWLKYFPPQLLERNKWFHTRANLNIGDLVIVLEPGLKNGKAPRSQWKKAIVSEVHPSPDGLVRTVTLRDSNHKFFKRPIHKLCLIASNEELSA